MKKTLWLYQFRVNREKEVSETETTKNEKGEEITITRKVKRNVPVLYAIKKPNRRTYEDGELFFGVSLSEGIKAGLLTRQLLAKRFDNDGGTFSESEKERYTKLYRELYEFETEIQKTQLNLSNLSEPEKVKKVSELLVKMAEIKQELQEFEDSRSAIFDQTAETRAKNKTIMWWVLQLSHVKEDDGLEKFVPLFGEGNHESKLDIYDELEESEQPHVTEAIKKFAYFISFWYTGKVTDEDDFKNVENYINQQQEKSEPTTEETVETVETAGETVETKPESPAETKAEAAKTEPEAAKESLLEASKEPAQEEKTEVKRKKTKETEAKREESSPV